MKNRITDLLGIDYPIVSGGMVWCSGWRLASSVSLAGGLGLLGAGSMHPDMLIEHIAKTRQALEGSGRPFGINLPIFYPDIEHIIEIIIEHKVDIVFTSAGNPAIYTQRLKSHGIKVVHVVSTAKFAAKAEAAGVDAVVAEGFEAGGHNGRDEITTMALIPQVCAAVKIPVIAAGGIATGRGVLAALALGAEGVQMGTRFALAEESSAHDNFKKLCTNLGEGDTVLSMKKLMPVRLIKNEFFERVAQAEARGASADELREILGSRRAKLGMFEGDLTEGELEIGQISSLIRTVEPVSLIFEKIIAEYNETITQIQSL